MLLRTPDQAPCTLPLVIEAAGQRYRQTTQLLHLGCFIDASADIMPEIKRRVRLARACYSRFKRELYDMEGCPVRSKVAHAKDRGNGNPAVRVCNVGPSARSTSLSCERHNKGLSYGSLASSADNAQTTSRRTPRSFRRQIARASRRPSPSGCLLFAGGV